MLLLPYERCSCLYHQVLQFSSLFLSYLSNKEYPYRHYRYEQKLASLLWKVNPKDIILPDLGSINSDAGRTKSEYTLQNLRSTINVSNPFVNNSLWMLYILLSILTKTKY